MDPRNIASVYSSLSEIMAKLGGFANGPVKLVTGMSNCWGHQGLVCSSDECQCDWITVE